MSMTTPAPDALLPARWQKSIKNTYGEQVITVEIYDVPRTEDSWLRGYEVRQTRHILDRTSRGLQERGYVKVKRFWRRKSALAQAAAWFA